MMMAAVVSTEGRPDRNIPWLRFRTHLLGVALQTHWEFVPGLSKSGCSRCSHALNPHLWIIVLVGSIMFWEVRRSTSHTHAFKPRDSSTWMRFRKMLAEHLLHPHEPVMCLNPPLRSCDQPWLLQLGICICTAVNMCGQRIKRADMGWASD